MDVISAGHYPLFGNNVYVHMNNLADHITATQRPDLDFMALVLSNVATHELGHSFGWFGHLPDDSGSFLEEEVFDEPGLEWSPPALRRRLVQVLGTK